MQDRHTKSIRARGFSILIHGELFQTPCAGFFNFIWALKSTLVGFYALFKRLRGQRHVPA